MKPRKKSLPTVHLGTDHAGVELKNALKDFLVRRGHHVVDHGAYDDRPSDYPDFVIAAAEAVARSKGKARGIVLGGSGIGECIAANKVHGVRAALAYDAYTARITREHNDSNVLCLGSRTVTKGLPLAKRLVRIWLDTDFSKAVRHVRRIRKIHTYERRSRR